MTTMVIRRKTEKKRVAILGWGSLLWEGGDAFDQWHGPWRFDGPVLKIEFGRVSSRRLGALTLVIDAQYGSPIQVAWCLSKRASLDDAASDLRAREETTIDRVARLELKRSGDLVTDEPAATIATWTKAKRLDAVVWTALGGNFSKEAGVPFSVAAAAHYVKTLTAAGKAKAAEYVWRAPDFVDTPLRAALQQEPWFEKPSKPPAS